MATQSFEQLIAGANKIKQNQLPESNTAGIVGEQLIQMVNKQQEEEAERLRGITEYNVSVQHPTSGIGGTNKYTLEGAIAKIPAAYRRVGIKCSFVAEDGSVQIWQYLRPYYDMLSNWCRVDANYIANIEKSSVFMYSSSGKQVDGQMSVDSTTYPCDYLREKNSYTNSNTAVSNLGRIGALCPTQPVFDDKYRQKKWQQFIVGIYMGGTWQLSSVDRYYISYFADLGDTPEGVHRRKINITCYLDSTTTIVMTEITVEYKDNDGVVRVDFIGRKGDGRTEGIYGYILVDIPIMMGLPSRYSLTYENSKVQISDLNTYEVYPSIFSNKLKEKLSGYAYKCFTRAFYNLVLNGIIDHKIYLVSFNKNKNGDGTGISISLGKLVNDTVVDVAHTKDNAYRPEGDYTLEFQEVNGSGISGSIDFSIGSDGYFVSNVFNNAASLPYYEIVNFTTQNTHREEDKPVVKTESFSYPILNRGFLQIALEESKPYMLCVASDGWVYTKPFNYDSRLQRTKDFVNYENVHTFPIYINSVCEMADGELLVMIGHNASTVDKIGVWRSFNKRTEWRQVIQPSSLGSVWSSWSRDVFGDIVIIGEYGNFNADVSLRQSRYLYMSRDAGITFKKILDLANAPVFFEGYDYSLCHIHGACYDPYWDRVWLVTGDGNNSKMLAWTDNDGASWKGINLYNYTGGDIADTTLQFIMVRALRDRIILTPDCPYQYIFSAEKVDKDAIPVINKRWAFRNTGLITHLTVNFAKFGAGEPTLIVQGRSANVVPTEPEDLHNFIVGTFDGIDYFKVWEDELITKYPNKGASLFKMPDGRYLVDIDHNIDGLKEARHDWVWLDGMKWN